MRIAFLAGSIAPGGDGVGDYALSLASFLAGQGHDVGVIGWADRGGDAAFAAGEGYPFRRLSIAASRSEAARAEACGAFLREFAPDWISLQFVSYAFDRRGLVWNLGLRLRRIAPEAAWHVMFHEVWVGAKRGASWKERLLGLAQRAAIRRSMAALRPTLVHTSNRVYRTLLARAGLDAGILPLFGNIPVAPADPALDGEVRALLLPHGIDLDDAPARSRLLLAGFFGALHPVWPPEPLLGHFAAAQAASGRRTVFVSAGRLGPGAALWERLRRDYGNRFGFVTLGERPPALISRLLQRLDCGIATTPWQVIGKSGSAAAMAEHGLPVIVNRTERYGLPAEEAASPGPPYLPLDGGLTGKLVSLPPRRPALSLLPEVGRRFLMELETGNRVGQSRP